MKKLVTMAVLLIVLGLCLPAYSADANDNVLVYKVSISGKVIDDVNGIQSGSIKGYLVVDVNTAITDVNTTIDDCNLIAYGKNDDGVKVQYTWAGVNYDADVTSSIGVDFWQPGYWFEGILIGKNVKETDIGVDADVEVAKNLSGHILLWCDPLTGTSYELLGSGKISMKLDNRFTRECNELDYTTTEAVTAIEEYLEVEKGYLP
jgi:hypothetical protein